MVRPVSFGASVRTTVSTSGNSGTRFRIDENVVAFHFDCKLIELHCRVVIVLASLAVVSPLMPGTHNGVFLQRALTDGPAGVRTNSPQRVQLPALITDRVRVVAQRYFHDRVWRQRRERTNFDESHTSIVLPPRD